MEEKRNDLLPPWVPVTVGLFLALAVFAVAMMLVILLFGERASISAASHGSLILSILSVLCYAAAELTLYPRVATKSLLALSYFASFALLAILSFRLIATTDLAFVFDFDPATAKALLLSGCYRLCAANAILLVLRIGLEIARYVKNLLHL